MSSEGPRRLRRMGVTPPAERATLISVMNARIDAVKSACRGVDGLEAAVVFGSVLRSERPRDLDVALLWRSELDATECWRRANRIAGLIERALPGPGLNVDVKDLRRLDIPIRFRVLRDGVVAFQSDRRAFVRFKAETMSIALDFLPWYERSLRASAKRLADGGP